MMARRLGLAVVTFLVVIAVTFAISRLAPGDASADEIATSAAVAEWRALRGVDAPFVEQLGRWLVASCKLELGSSFVDGRPVRDRVVESLAHTVPLTLTSAALAYAVGIPVGFLLALHDEKRRARFVTFGLFALHGIPVFWVALLLGLAARATNLPTPRGNALAAVFAIACLSYPAIARIARYQRAAVLETLGAGFVRVARAKGLPERLVLLRYVLRPTLVAPVSLLASEIPWLLGGSVIVERVFTLPGMGTLAFESILRRDTPVIMGVTALIACVTICSTLVADALFVLVDPRRRA